MSAGANTKNMRLWPVIYPILLYFATSQILDVMQQMLPFTAGFDAVMRQGVDTLGGLAVLYLSFLKGGRRDKGCLPVRAFDAARVLPGAFDGVHRSDTTGQTASGCLLSALMLGLGSFALNNLFAMTELLQRSEGYRFVERSFYSSGLFWEIAVLCILTPVTEELLYRGIVFSRLRDWLGRWGAIVSSALLFGVMHMNVVQTLYAFGLGLLLGILMERYGDVRVPMCGHIAANLLSVLRGELELFADLAKGSAVYWAATLAAFAAAAGLAGFCIARFPERELYAREPAGPSSD